MSTFKIYLTFYPVFIELPRVLSFPIVFSIECVHKGAVSVCFLFSIARLLETLYFTITAKMNS